MTDHERWVESQLAWALGILYQCRPHVPERLATQIDAALARKEQKK